MTIHLIKYYTVPLCLGTEGCLQQLQAGKPKSPLGTWRGKCLMRLLLCTVPYSTLAKLALAVRGADHLLSFISSTSLHISFAAVVFLALSLTLGYISSTLGYISSTIP